jgi:hypothetical protein
MFLKFLVLTLFAVAFYISVLWLGATERGFSPAQRATAGVVAIAGWVLTFALASMV